MGACSSSEGVKRSVRLEAPTPTSGLQRPGNTLLDDAEPLPKLCRSPKSPNVSDNPTPPESPKLPPAPAPREDSVPKVTTSKSAPVLLPSRAVPSRQDKYVQSFIDISPAASEAQLSRLQAEEASPAPMAKELRSPSTALGETRKKKKRNVTFGEAQCHQFRVDSENQLCPEGENH